MFSTPPSTPTNQGIRTKEPSAPQKEKLIGKIDQLKLQLKELKQMVGDSVVNEKLLRDVCEERGVPDSLIEEILRGHKRKREETSDQYKKTKQQLDIPSFPSLGGKKTRRSKNKKLKTRHKK